MKTFIKVLGVIAVVLIALFLVVSLTIDGIIKSTIQDVGSDLLQTEVNVDDVSVSILSSTGYIDGIMVENPEGFSDSTAIALKEISIDLDLFTLLSDTVVINQLIIDSPEVFVEQTTQGNNLMALQNNMSEGSTDESGGFIIDYLLVEEGVLTAHIDIGGEQRTTEVSIERFEQKNIGRSGNNTVESTVRQILEPLLEQALRKAVEGGLQDQVEDKLKNLFDG